MCFSAEASFTAGAIILPAGLYCVRNAARKDYRYLALAAIPLVFSAQQFCEGFVWLGLGQSNQPLARGAALVFLFFALFFWPFWVPFSVACIEPRRGLRQFLSVLSLLALVFGWALYGPVVFDPLGRLDLRVLHHSIRYDVRATSAFDQFPGFGWQLCYLATISCPLVASANRQFRIFGFTLALSWALSHLVFRYALESVWCFFAAALSVQLCYAFRELPAWDKEPPVRALVPRP